MEVAVVNCRQNQPESLFVQPSVLTPVVIRTTQCTYPSRYSYNPVYLPQSLFVQPSVLTPVVIRTTQCTYPSRCFASNRRCRTRSFLDQPRWTSAECAAPSHKRAASCAGRRGAHRSSQRTLPGASFSTGTVTTHSLANEFDIDIHVGRLMFKNLLYFLKK